MNIREKREANKRRVLDDDAFSKKLHYDAMQNELSTMIRNTIPNQVTVVRTLMWINLVFLGLAFQLKEIVFNF